MKKNICALVFIVLFLSCNQSNSNNKDSIGNEGREIVTNIIQQKDTLVGDFHIHYQLLELPNDAIIKIGELFTGENISLEYYNRVVDVDLKYKGKNILNKKIDKNDFTSIIPKDNLNEFQIWSFYIEEISNNNITFSVSVCIPDTDNCYFILYAVSETGNVQVSEEEVEWEE